MGDCIAITDPCCAEHDNPLHPECNARLEIACTGIPGSAILQRAEPAPVEIIRRIHTPYYLDWLRQSCASMTSIGWLDPDTYITRYSFEAARHAAGAAIAAVHHGLDGTSCFALVRPPGHHAEHDRARGFCLLNNAAIAAAEALDHVDRVLVVDWDVHHGNGTQDAFFGSDRVLYCSVHQGHHFPFSGFPGETGIGKGEGYTINAPLRAGSGIADYFAVFTEIFSPAIERFRPDAAIISAGQDLLSDDPLGSMNIRPEDLEYLTRIIREAAGLPIALVLEGGYGVSHGDAVARIFSGLGPGRTLTGLPAPGKTTRDLITLLKKVHTIP